MTDQSDHGIYARAMQLAPLFRASMPNKEAQNLTGISKSSIYWFYLVFKHIESGLTDGEIARKQTNFRAGSVAAIRSAYSNVATDSGNNKNVERFLIGHRQRMYGLADRLASASSPDIEPWPSEWLAKSWPQPLTGLSDGRPLLEPENETQFAFMLEHLAEFRVKESLEKVHVLARQLRRLALEIQ